MERGGLTYENHVLGKYIAAWLYSDSRIVVFSMPGMDKIIYKPKLTEMTGEARYP